MAAFTVVGGPEIAVAAPLGAENDAVHSPVPNVEASHVGRPSSRLAFIVEAVACACDAPVPASDRGLVIASYPALARDHVLFAEGGHTIVVDAVSVGAFVDVSARLDDAFVVLALSTLAVAGLEYLGAVLVPTIDPRLAVAHPYRPSLGGTNPTRSLGTFVAASARPVGSLALLVYDLPIVAASAAGAPRTLVLLAVEASTKAILAF